jgi:hypothetical protein
MRALRCLNLVRAPLMNDHEQASVCSDDAGPLATLEEKL